MANDGTMPVDAALAATRGEDRSPGSAHRAGATILVVEDDADIRTLAVDYLTFAGYRVLSADDGSAALATLESGVAIDLVFSDIVMPGRLSGTELAARARRLRPGIKVVLTSGYAQHPAAQPATFGEIDGFLAKPYKPSELARRIRAVLAD